MATITGTPIGRTFFVIATKAEVNLDRGNPDEIFYEPGQMMSNVTPGKAYDFGEATTSWSKATMFPTLESAKKFLTDLKAWSDKNDLVWWHMDEDREVTTAGEVFEIVSIVAVRKQTFPVNDRPSRKKTPDNFGYSMVGMRPGR